MSRYFWQSDPSLIFQSSLWGLAKWFLTKSMCPKKSKIMVTWYFQKIIGPLKKSVSFCVLFFYKHFHLPPTSPVVNLYIAVGWFQLKVLILKFLLQSQPCQTLVIHFPHAPLGVVSQPFLFADPFWHIKLSAERSLRNLIGKRYVSLNF